MKMSIEDLKSVISDVRNSEEKKNLYILIGVLIALVAIAAGIAAILVKRHCDECEEWDEDDFCDDDYECDDDCCCCDDDTEEETTEEE